MSDTRSTQGHVDIYEATVFQVYDWSADRDSGANVGTFMNRAEAITFAQKWAEDHGRLLNNCDAIDLRNEKEART